MKDTAMLRLFIFVASATLFFYLLDQSMWYLITIPVFVIILAICVSYRDVK